MKYDVKSLQPIYDKDSEILILGTLPEKDSLKENFYYVNKNNKFWSIISDVLGIKKPESKEEKIKMLLDNKIAIWDVLASGDRKGSSDKYIKNETPNDFYEILKNSKIKKAK